MKQIFGVKLAGSFTRSKRWIAANHKSDIHGFTGAITTFALCHKDIAAKLVIESFLALDTNWPQHGQERTNEAAQEIIKCRVAADLVLLLLHRRKPIGPTALVA